MTVVAKIDKDWLFEQWNSGGGEYGSDSLKDKEFDYAALESWWGWKDGDLPTEQDIIGAGHTRFKLYDDDGELYYEGFLFNDPQGIVQQFVLRSAEADSGCTTIKIQKPDLTWVQEIG